MRVKAESQCAAGLELNYVELACFALTRSQRFSYFSLLSAGYRCGPPFIVFCFLRALLACPGFWKSTIVYDSVNICTCACIYVSLESRDFLWTRLLSNIV